MIPYFRPPAIPIPGTHDLGIQPWGILVATGFMVGSWYSQRLAVQRGQEPRHFNDIVTWLAVGAIVFGHLGHALFYDPAYYFAHPVDFLKVWSGLSSFGGFFGCTFIAIYFFRSRKLDILKFSDLLMVGLVLGWAIGRVGCTVVHDHIGQPVADAPGWVQQTIGWLGVDYPDGIAGGKPGAVRFNLGLLDSLVSWIIFGILAFLARTPRRPGLLTGMGPILYGACRFWLDFLRNTDLSHADARYFGLTPAQYGSVAIIVVGLWVIRRGSRRPPWPEATPAGSAGT
jgi:phosphatidylglycerol:prolipoprotein diacylglycerol transferase